jgi:phosphate transport system substrate-binding protein
MHRSLAWALGTVLVLGGVSSVSAQTINGGGSTFVAPLMEKWGSVFKKDKSITVNYVSVGSGAGVKQLIDESLDFACTDAPLTDEQLTATKEKGGELVHIPVSLGGIVAAYNLDALDKPLRLSGGVLADIFLGKITKWNDPAIKELNAGVDLPDQAITVLHRSDASGSTYIFTDYLSKVSPEWKKNVGTGTSVKWPAGAGHKGSEGLVDTLNRTPGAIGYVELLYALKNKQKFAAIKNREGNYCRASLESVTAAAKASLNDIPADLRFSLTNAPGEESYPMSGCTWVVLYVKQDKDRGKRVVDFLTWALHDGQEYNTDLYYARIPKGLAEKAAEKLKEVKFEK